MSSARFAFVTLVLVAASGCFAIFPLDEFQDGASPLEGGASEGGAADGANEIGPADGGDASKTVNGRVIFVTTGAFDGQIDSQLVGLNGADAVCARVAALEKYAGTFKALMGDGSVAAKDRIAADIDAKRTAENLPIIDSRGRLVAPSMAVLFAKGPAVTIELTEKGAQVVASADEAICVSDGKPVPIVWTGSIANGATKDPNCQAWASAGSGQMGLVGIPSVKDEWIGSRCPMPSCNKKAHIYCVQE